MTRDIGTPPPLARLKKRSSNHYARIDGWAAKSAAAAIKPVGPDELSSLTFVVLFETAKRLTLTITPRRWADMLNTIDDLLVRSYGADVNFTGLAHILAATQPYYLHRRTDLGDGSSTVTLTPEGVQLVLRTMNTYMMQIPNQEWWNLNATGINRVIDILHPMTGRGGARNIQEAATMYRARANEEIAARPRPRH